MGGLIPLKEAQSISGMSKNTLNALIQRRGITVYDNPRDRRQKLIDRDELLAALRPQPLLGTEEEPEVKNAA